MIPRNTITHHPNNIIQNHCRCRRRRNCQRRRRCGSWRGRNRRSWRGRRRYRGRRLDRGRGNSARASATVLMWAAEGQRQPGPTLAWGRAWLRLPQAEAACRPGGTPKSVQSAQWRPSRQLVSDADCANPELQPSQGLLILPLPPGEGWGEGEMPGLYTMAAHERERPHPDSPPEGEGTFKRPYQPSGPPILPVKSCAIIRYPSGFRSPEAVGPRVVWFSLSLRERAGVRAKCRAYPMAAHERQRPQATRRIAPQGGRYGN